MELLFKSQFFAVARKRQLSRKACARGGFSTRYSTRQSPSLKGKNGQKLLDRRQGVRRSYDCWQYFCWTPRETSCSPAIHKCSSPRLHTDTARGMLRTLRTVHVVGVLHAFRHAPPISRYLFEGPREELESVSSRRTDCGLIA